MSGPGPRQGVDRRRTRRRRTVVALAAVAAIAVGASPATAGATAEVSADRHLLVADPAAQRLYTYRVSDLRRTGQLDGVELAAHAGTVLLPDGRLLFVDDEQGQVVALTVDGRGRPTVQQRIDIPGERPWEGAVWAAVDPGANYFAVTSGYDESPEQTVTVVDLFDYSVGQLPVTLDRNAAGGFDELHVWLAGQPLQVVVSTGGRLRSYGLQEVMAGRSPAETSSAPAGPGTHGPVLSRDGDRLLVTTTEGVDRVRIVGDQLRDHRTIPYPGPGPLLQNYRPRLAQDGRTLYGPISRVEGLRPEQWAQTSNRLHTVDLTTETARTAPLPAGIVGRSAQSARHALFPVIGGQQDTAAFVDVDRSSPQFRSVVRSVRLQPLTKGPRPGTASAGTERRSAAITTRGDRGFVSHGGDGLISVVEPGRAAVRQTVRTPTPLRGGGYLVVVEPGRALVDVLAR